MPSCPAPSTDASGRVVWTFTIRNTTVTVTADPAASAVSSTMSMAGSRFTALQSNAATGDESIVQRVGQGSRELDLFLHDGVMNGTIDGEALAPFTSDTQQVTLADGSPLPNFPDVPLPADAQAALDFANACLSDDPVFPACSFQRALCQGQFNACIAAVSCNGATGFICTLARIIGDFICSLKAQTCFGGIPDVGGGCCNPADQFGACCDGSSCIGGDPKGKTCSGEAGHCANCPVYGNSCDPFASPVQCCPGEVCYQASPGDVTGKCCGDMVASCGSAFGVS
jgi:hypothetical protein